MPRVDPAQALGLMREAGLEPNEPFQRSNAKWSCTCLVCGNTDCAPTYNDIQSGKGGCWKCRNKKIGDSLRLDAAASAALMRAAGWQPLEPYPGAGKPWQCSCVVCWREYPKKLSHVKNGTAGCQNCLGMDITDAEARSIMQQHGMEPLKGVPYPGSQRHWPSRCADCGEVQEKVSLSKIRYRGRMCGTCWEERRGESLTLDQAEADDRMTSHGWQPLEPYPGRVDRPWLARCELCGVVSQPILHNIQEGRRSCSTCAQRGIDYEKPGILYVVYNSGWAKIGIATNTDRLAQHRRAGWFEESRWHTSTARIARKAELRVLTYAREHGYGHMPAEEQMPHRGYTETVPVTLRSWLARSAARVIDGGSPLRLKRVGPSLPVHPKARS